MTVAVALRRSVATGRTYMPVKLATPILEERMGRTKRHQQVPSHTSKGWEMSPIRGCSGDTRVKGGPHRTTPVVSLTTRFTRVGPQTARAASGITVSECHFYGGGGGESTRPVSTVVPA